MSHAQLASTPTASTTLGATIRYTNPDGSTSTTPTDPPNSINLTSYNPAQSNPLLDICGYAAGAQTRTVYVMIQKPAYYWLTFAALGSADAFGGQIDDVKLIAVGSLYGSAPSGFVTIPVPAPAAGGAYTNSGAFDGFSIVADPIDGTRAMKALRSACRRTGKLFFSYLRDSRATSAVEFAIISMPFFFFAVVHPANRCLFHRAVGTDSGVLETAQSLSTGFHTGTTANLPSAGTLKSEVVALAGAMISND